MSGKGRRVLARVGMVEHVATCQPRPIIGEPFLAGDEVRTDQKVDPLADGVPVSRGSGCQGLPRDHAGEVITGQQGHLDQQDPGNNIADVLPRSLFQRDTTRPPVRAPARRCCAMGSPSCRLLPHIDSRIDSGVPRARISGPHASGPAEQHRLIKLPSDHRQHTSPAPAPTPHPTRPQMSHHCHLKPSLSQPLTRGLQWIARPSAADWVEYYSSAMLRRCG